MSYPMKLQKTIHSNFHVVVVPELNTWFFDTPTGQKEYDRHSAQCREIAASIKRHVDGVASASFECNTKTVCKFCEYEPEPVETISGIDDEELVGMPICCDPAIKARKEEMNLKVWQDGDKWCAAHLDFANLQESPCGFGNSAQEAWDDLKAKSKHIPHA